MKNVEKDTIKKCYHRSNENEAMKPKRPKREKNNTLNRSCTVVAVAYQKSLDFVIQRIFITANFRAETQPFIRQKDE